MVTTAWPVVHAVSSRRPSIVPRCSLLAARCWWPTLAKAAPERHAPCATRHARRSPRTTATQRRRHMRGAVSLCCTELPCARCPPCTEPALPRWQKKERKQHGPPVRPRACETGAWRSQMPVREALPPGRDRCEVRLPASASTWPGRPLCPRTRACRAAVTSAAEQRSVAPRRAGAGGGPAWLLAPQHTARGRHAACAPPRERGQRRRPASRVREGGVARRTRAQCPPATRA